MSDQSPIRPMYPMKIAALTSPSNTFAPRGERERARSAQSASQSGRATKSPATAKTAMNTAIRMSLAVSFSWVSSRAISAERDRARKPVAIISHMTTTPRRRGSFQG